MEVLVSGSSGLIGTALRRALRNAGHRPIRLTRSQAEPDGDTVRWEPTGGRIESGALEGLDAVVHLAGEPMRGRWTDAKKRRIRDSRVQGTRLLAEALAGRQRPPAVMLSASAVGWYGRRGDEVLTEDSDPGGGFLAEVCRAWEAAAAPAEQAGIRVVHLRTGLVMSSDGGLLGIVLLPFRLGLGGKLGSGRQWMPWIAIDDHVTAQLHLLQRAGASGPVNLSAPNPVRNAEFTRTLGRVLGRPTVLTVPTPAVALVFGRDAARELATASQRAVPERLTQELGFSFRYPQLEAALRAELDRPRDAGD